MKLLPTLAYCFAWFAAACCASTPSAASEVVIDFESDIVDTRSRRFTSNDSPLAIFIGDNPLWIRNGEPEFDGTGIETFGPKGITIEFLRPIVSLSVLFGNDDSRYPEDRALLVAYRDVELIGQETLLFNDDNVQAPGPVLSHTLVIVSASLSRRILA